MLAAITMFLLFLLTPPSSSARPDESPDLPLKLQMQVPEYTLGDADFVHALAATATKFNLPMGIEWTRSPDTLMRVNRSWNNKTVQQILASIINSQPGYRLVLSDGIVHICLRKMDSDQKDFLNLKIDNFELKNQVVEIGSRKLREVVRSRISPAQSRRQAGIGYSQATNIGDPELSFSLQNTSVRKVIDKLALASDRKIWIVTYVGDSIDPVSGYRRTATLWNDSKIPNSEQPSWDMFRWSDRIP